MVFPAFSEASEFIQLPAASPATVPAQHAWRLSFEGGPEAVPSRDESHNNGDDDDAAADDDAEDGDDDRWDIVGGLWGACWRQF